MEERMERLKVISMMHPSYLPDLIEFMKKDIKERKRTLELLKNIKSSQQNKK